jgi:iron(III) transport system ATP-binding protein
MSFLSLQAVRKHYGAVAALDDVDLAVPQGSRTAILGPSGSGKSTLLRIVGGFEVPDAGRVTLGGDMLADGPRAMPAHLRGIGLVAQEGALFPHLSVADNIGFGLKRDTPGRAARIGALVEMVGLEQSMLGRQPDQLSGGQQQRVALARALARQPRLMLLDEPFSALDTGLRASTRKAVAELLGQAGITTILVTHDQAEALSFADQVVVMRDGQLLQAGTPRDLYLRPRDAMVANFLGDAIILRARITDGWAECALGRVPVADSIFKGRAEIMLRPEQVTISAAKDAAGGAIALVLNAEFSGAQCSCVVRLAGGPEGGEVLLTLRGTYLSLPAIGAMLNLSIEGTAHVLS